MQHMFFSGRVLPSLIALFLVCFMATQAQAALNGARATSSKTHLLASTQNTFSITWKIAATQNHTQGVTSRSAAQVVNPSSGAELLTLGSTLTQPGSGPFQFSENLTISGRQVNTWLESGIKRVIIRRIFEEPAGASVSADLLLTLDTDSLGLNRQGAEGLTIHQLQLSLFSPVQEMLSGNQDIASLAKIIDQYAIIQPLLTLNYAGTGLLEGRWLIAEPESTQGQPIFRTVAVVRQALMKSQQTRITGPVLPSSRPGKYLIRFCINHQSSLDSENNSSSICPVPALMIESSYQVMPNTEPVSVLTITDAPAQVDGASTFSWQAVDQAVLYKLVIFEKISAYPQFVTGMLLPDSYTQTVISEIVQNKLINNRPYQWQVSAINAQGRVLAKSKLHAFSYIQEDTSYQRPLLTSKQ